jgi:hypothetical protein
MGRLLASFVALFVLVAIGLSIYRLHSKRVPDVAAENVLHDPILIPGVQEPEEMRVEPIPVEVLTPPERMLGNAMQQVGSNSNPAALLPALARILAKYPDYSDGYVMRLGSLCSGNDRPTILSNINSALKYAGNSRTGKDSTSSLLSMRAKIEHTSGDDTDAMGDLDKAIQADLSNSTQFVNSGAIAPEKTASACTWTEPDMDALVQRFPTDYRAYLFRGLYYGFFTEWNENSLKPALENFRRATELNISTTMPHLFIASILNRAFGIKKYGILSCR